MRIVASATVEVTLELIAIPPETEHLRAFSKQRPEDRKSIEPVIEFRQSMFTSLRRTPTKLYSRKKGPAVISSTLLLPELLGVDHDVFGLNFYCHSTALHVRKPHVCRSRENGLRITH